jgi:hypothetical protein
MYEYTKIKTMKNVKNNKSENTTVLLFIYSEIYTSMLSAKGR